MTATPARQPQEGGITCSGCHKDVRSGYFLCDDCYATHTSPRAPVSIKMRMPPDLEEFWLREHDAQVAKAAREQVLGIMRPHVLYFALCMEEKLRKHDQDRGERGWVGYVSEEEVEYLFNRLKNEVEELLKEIKKNPLSKQFPESRDVGNFAMMIDTAHFSDAEINPMIRELMRSLRGAQEEQG